MKWDDLLEGVAIFAPLAPMLDWVWHRWRKHPMDPMATWIVWGLSISLAAEAVNLSTHGNNLWVTYLYAPAQFILFACAVSRGPVRMLATAGITALGLLSMMRGPWTEYELVVQVMGGLIVAFLAWGQPGPVSRAIRVYCLATIPPLIGLALTPTLGWWAAYQLVRVGAIGRLTWAMGRVDDGHGPRGARRVERAHVVGAP